MRYECIFINGNRDCYHPEQMDHGTLTVGELIRSLQGFDEDAEVWLRNDGGYTYGSLNSWDMNWGHYDDEDEDVYVND